MTNSTPHIDDDYLFSDGMTSEEIEFEDDRFMAQVSNSEFLHACRVCEVYR